MGRALSEADPGIGKRRSGGVKSAGRVIARSVGAALALWGFFWLAGGWAWVEGWIFVGLVVLGQGGSGVYLYRRDLELITRRGRMGDGTAWWDKLVLGLFGLAYCGSLMVAALEARDPASAPAPGWT